MENTSPWLHQDQMYQLLPLSLALPVITHAKVNEMNSYTCWGWKIFDSLMLINIPVVLLVPALRYSQQVQWLPDTQTRIQTHQSTDVMLSVPLVYLSHSNQDSVIKLGMQLFIFNFKVLKPATTYCLTFSPGSPGSPGSPTLPGGPFINM